MRLLTRFAFVVAIACMTPIGGVSASDLPSCDYSNLSLQEIKNLVDDAVRSINPESETPRKDAAILIAEWLGCSLEVEADEVVARRAKLASCDTYFICPAGDTSGVDFCGVGRLEKGRDKPFDKVLDTSRCLNDLCCLHDFEYTRYCVDSPKCIWTPQSKTTGADDMLHNSCKSMDAVLIPFSVPPMYEVTLTYFSPCCDVVGYTKLTRNILTCELVALFNVDLPLEEERCDRAGGIGCDVPSGCGQAIAMSHFPVWGDILHLLDPERSLTITEIKGKWSCEPGHKVGPEGYRWKMGGPGSPVPDAKYCSLIGCMGTGCTPGPVGVGTTFTLPTGKLFDTIYIGVNDGDTANNDGWLPICAERH